MRIHRARTARPVVIVTLTTLVLVVAGCRDTGSTPRRFTIRIVR